MKHLTQSFEDKFGIRGVHIYNERECRFLSWSEVVAFLKDSYGDDEVEFSERLLTTLANYNPDGEFLAVQKLEDTVSIELHSIQ